MSDDDYLMVIAGVAENLAFLMPTGAAEEATDNWLIHVQVQWVGPDGTRGRIIVALDQGAAEATVANLLGLPPGDPPTDPGCALRLGARAPAHPVRRAGARAMGLRRCAAMRCQVRNSLRS